MAHILLNILLEIPESTTQQKGQRLVSSRVLVLRNRYWYFKINGELLSTNAKYWMFFVFPSTIQVMTIDVLQVSILALMQRLLTLRNSMLNLPNSQFLYLAYQPHDLRTTKGDIFLMSHLTPWGNEDILSYAKLSQNIPKTRTNEVHSTLERP